MKTPAPLRGAGVFMRYHDRGMEPALPPPEIPVALPPSSPPTPVLTPAVYETRVPQRFRTSVRRRPAFGTMVAIAFLVCVLVILVLYFWGAAISNRPA
jgi:hypothetical protein